MSGDLYFGSYARFEAPSKKEAGLLLGADNLVGDLYEIEFITADGLTVAWMKNRFDARIGFFDHGTSRELSLLNAKGWRLHALLSFVAYSEQPLPGLYWGEAALICFDEEIAGPFEEFTRRIALRMAEGIRPDVSLGAHAVSQVIESEGAWKPTKTVPLPQKKPGVALVKTRRNMTERLVEQGRQKNKGCYFVTFAIFAAIIIGIVFGLKACGVF